MGKMLRTVGLKDNPNYMSPPSPFKPNPILHKAFFDGQNFRDGKLLRSGGKPSTSGKPSMVHPSQKFPERTGGKPSTSAKLSMLHRLPESPCKKSTCLADFNDLSEDYEDLKEQKKVVEKERDDALYQLTVSRQETTTQRQLVEHSRREILVFKQKLERIHQISTLNCSDDWNTSGLGSTLTTENQDSESETSKKVILNKKKYYVSTFFITF